MSKAGKGRIHWNYFSQVQEEAVQPDYVTFMRVLSACASVVLEEGGSVHEQIIQIGGNCDIIAGISLLVDMYTKWRLFNKMPSWNVVTLDRRDWDV